jgi:hypothetical protein
MRVKKTKILALIISLALITATGIVALATYGTAEDPLVTLSYLNDVFKPAVLSQANEATDQKIQSLTSSQGGTSEPVGSEAGLGGYQVIKLGKGDILIGKEGTEIIFRSGQAMAVSPFQDQGISDVTGGKDILNGLNLEKNHLYIVPRSDGRGLDVRSDEAYFLVRGAYSVNRPDLLPAVPGS